MHLHTYTLYGTTYLLPLSDAYRGRFLILQSSNVSTFNLLQVVVAIVGFNLKKITYE